EPPVPLPPVLLPPVAFPPPEPPALGRPPVDVVPPLPPVVAGFPDEVHAPKRAQKASNTTRGRWRFMTLHPGWAVLENRLTQRARNQRRRSAPSERATQAPRRAIAVAPAAISSTEDSDHPASPPSLNA